MPKINVYVPDELAEAIKATGVPVSAVCQRALEQAVRRVTAIRETAMGDLDDAALATRLPNFTDRARNVLRRAISEAHARTDEVGTAAILAAVCAPDEPNMAHHVLRAIEIEPAEVIAELARRPRTEPAPHDATGDRFSTPATIAMELTVTEATSLGHNYVGCEHLILGLIAETDGVAGQVLRSLGADLRLARRAVVTALAMFAHVRAQQQQPSGAAAPREALRSALAEELAPLLIRIESLERRVGPCAD